MVQRPSLHVLTVGWDQKLIEGICDRIAAKSNHSFSHLVIPICDAKSFREKLPGEHIHWFFDTKQMAIPPADQDVLASLEQADVPTVHNMILGDPVASKLPYEEALAYASFL